MNQDLTDYLLSIQHKLTQKESLYVVYGVYGRRITKIGSSNNRRKSNQILSDYLEEYEVDDGDIFLLVYYGFNMKKFLHGPMIMGCEIIPVKSTGKISRSKISVGAIHYLPKELCDRGFKLGDYRRLYKKIKSGEIKTGMKTWYSAIHLD